MCFIKGTLIPLIGPGGVMLPKAMKQGSLAQGKGRAHNAWLWPSFLCEAALEISTPCTKAEKAHERLQNSTDR
jgi:hypothetical protein